MPSEGSIQLGDRTIAYLEVGDPDGPLVLHNHGGPGSRLEAELFDSAATANGVRLIAVDRPGIGRSDPQPDRTWESWAKDLQSVADSLGADRFAVTGWSEGGPWALAAAAYLDPVRLVHVTCIAGGCFGTFGANWAAKYQDGPDKLGGFLAMHFHPGFKLMYELTLALPTKHFEDNYGKAIVKMVNTADQEVLSDEDNMKLFLAESKECFRQGSDGEVRDATMLYEAWPFDVGTVTRPVHFWQGTEDHLIPEALSKEVANGTPGAIWHSVEGGGHFIAVSHADQILALAASDLAQARS